MDLEPITLMGYRCRRCNHKWVPRVNAKGPPKVCPACKSPYWKEEPKRRRTTGRGASEPEGEGRG